MCLKPLNMQIWSLSFVLNGSTCDELWELGNWMFPFSCVSDYVKRTDLKAEAWKCDLNSFTLNFVLHASFCTLRANHTDSLVSYSLFILVVYFCCIMHGKLYMTFIPLRKFTQTLLYSVYVKNIPEFVSHWLSNNLTKEMFSYIGFWFWLLMETSQSHCDKSSSNLFCCSFCGFIP